MAAEAPDEFNGRVAIVVGAAQGVGRAVAYRLAAAGAHVAAFDADALGAQRTAAAIAAVGGSGEPGHVDPADEHALRAAIDALAARAGLDILVQDGAVAFAADGAAPADWQKALAATLRATAFAAEAAAPHLARSDCARIVNIAPAQAPRTAAFRGALAGLTRDLACDLAPQGILVNAVAPGLLELPGSTRPDAERLEAIQYIAARVGRIPLQRLGRPDEVAGLVQFLCSADAGYVTGQVVAIDGGFSAAV